MKGTVYLKNKPKNDLPMLENIEQVKLQVPNGP